MVNKKNSVTFHESKEFKSFELLQEKILLYKKQKFVKLWIRDSRSISAAHRRAKRPLTEAIKYYELTYACVNGSGKKFKPREKGERQTSLVVFFILNYIKSFKN